jgi:hypothetical protein
MKHSTVLAQLRPPTPDLDPQWSAQTLIAITERGTGRSTARPTQIELDHMQSPASARRPRRVRRAALLLAAAASVAVVAIPVLDSGDAVAADLRELSQAALTYDSPALGRGTWLHERSESLQRNDANLSDGAILDTERETWTSWDGQILLIERRPSQGWTTYNVLDDQTPASYQDPTPAFAQTLPTDAEGLRAYLDPKVFGSSSHSEALFEALSGLATSHTLPPATLAAAYEAIADIDNVNTSDVQIDGRPAIEITYEEDQTSSSDSITVDRATGQVLSATQQSLQSTYTSTTTLSEVLDTVPEAVLNAFEEHEEDVRYDTTGQPLAD